MKIVFGYLAWAPYAKVQFEAAVSRARGFGYDVVPFCLTPRAPGPRYLWPQLEAAWSGRDAEIVEVRERLLEACSDADIFWNVNGANVHPAWLADLRTFNVYGCFDDPESTAQLSEPVAKYFDAAFVGNLACLPMYQSWGMRRVAWCPIGIVHHDFPEGISTEVLVTRNRDIPTAFVGERESSWRQTRLDRLVSEFPDAVFRGNGWPLGRISDEDRRLLYRDTRVGWNIHNSLGPINVRLFALPANAVMQICDNRCRLGQFMKLEHEVIGFDTIEQCIDRTKYFLTHDAERSEIAANGHRRYLADYSENRIWDYYCSQFKEWLGGESRSEHPIDRLRWHEPPTTAGPTWIKSNSVRSRLLECVNRALLPLDLQICRSTLGPRNGSVSSLHVAAERLNTNQSLAELVAPAKKAMLRPGEFSEECDADPANLAFCWAIATIVGDAAQIVCTGALSPIFSDEVSADPRRRVFVSEPFSRTRNLQDNSRSNELVGCAAFDLAVSIDELISSSDYHSILGRLVKSAPKVIVATAQSDSSGSVPDEDTPFMQRSWTTDQFYWVLRAHWNSVTVYHMPNRFLPELKKAETGAVPGPLAAVCSDPRIASADTTIIESR